MEEKMPLGLEVGVYGVEVLEESGGRCGFVRYLTSGEIQKGDAMELIRLPTRPALYTDRDVLAGNPWFEQMLPVFTNAVARPSTILKANYNQFASVFFNNVSEALNNQKSPQEALQTIEGTARRMVH